MNGNAEDEAGSRPGSAAVWLRRRQRKTGRRKALDGTRRPPMDRLGERSDRLRGTITPCDALMERTPHGAAPRAALTACSLSCFRRICTND